MLDKGQPREEPIQYERRHNQAATANDVKGVLLDHATNCPTAAALRELQKEIQDLWKKIILIEVLDHRVTAVEDSLATIETNIAATMHDIHAIQTSMAASNVVHLWAGRIIIAVLSAALTFISAKYGATV